MKRISSLLLAMALVLGSIGAAKADGVDIKVQGQWDFAFVWQSNGGFKDSNNWGAKQGRSDDKFMARQRVRTQINFIISESLQGVLYFEIGNTTWGRNGGSNTGGRLDADGVNIKTRRAYLDWIIPNTEIAVRMGIQSLTLPNVMGSPVFDADVAGVLVSAPINEYVSIAAFWIRPFDSYGNDRYDGGWDTLDDEVDAFGLLLPIKGDGWSVTPWGIYARVGADSGLYSYLFDNDQIGTTVHGSSRLDSQTVSAWWAGLNFELTYFDPLTFKLDAMYGRLNRAELAFDYAPLGPGTYTADIGTKGWFIAAALDYKFDWGTPGIFGWYASGDDADDFADDGWLGRIPVVGIDQGFQPTSFGFAGSFSNGIDTAVSQTGTGTWGIGIQLADVSFIEDLSHTLRVAYYRGTNDEDMVEYLGTALPYQGDLYLTKKDSVWEVNFDHKYKIYENLTAVLELGYLHLRADEDVWGDYNGDEHDDAWRAQLIFQYKF